MSFEEEEKGPLQMLTKIMKELYRTGYEFPFRVSMVGKNGATGEVIVSLDGKKIKYDFLNGQSTSVEMDYPIKATCVDRRGKEAQFVIWPDDIEMKGEA